MPWCKMQYIYQEGQKVVLGEHAGRDNWTSEMDAYVGKVAVLIQKAGCEQMTGHPTWRVNIDAGQFAWREANMSRALKYPDKCPCEIASVRCDFHKNMPA